MLRDAEGRERRDGWCTPDLPRADISNQFYMVVLLMCAEARRLGRDADVALTFMVFIASWACSMVSIASHSVVCGRRSWLMICILSSEVLVEVRASGAAILCDTSATVGGKGPNKYQ